jgi:hypothetical protein
VKKTGLLIHQRLGNTINHAFIKQLKKITLMISIITFVVLSGCDQNQSHQAQQSVAPKVQIKVDNASWLRNKLPEKTLAYIRVPTIWNMFFEGSADSLYPALSHASNRAEIEKLQTALVDTYISKIPEAYKTHFKLLVKSIDTPLELAVTNAVDDSMVPNFLVGTTLKDFSKGDLQALLDSLVAESQNMVRILKPLSDDGKASLVAQMMPVFLDYDLSTGRLALLVGPTASDKVLMSMLAQKQAHQSLSSIMEFENSVDQSGKNQQAWVNVKAIYQQNQAMIPPPQKAMMEQMGLADMDFIWYGTAHHSGKGELIFHIQMPDTGLRKLLPRVNESFDIQTAGTPAFAFVLSLPTVEQISQAYEFIKVLNPELKGTDEKIQAGLAKINEYLGMDIAELLRAYGQQIIIVKDNSGLWFAQKIKDKKLNEKAFEIIRSKFDGKTQSKSLSGVAIDETSFSVLNLMTDFMPKQKGIDEMNEMFYGTQKIYTMEENGYFVWASVPQILSDRANSNNKNSLKVFLQNDLQLNWNQAFLAWATESEYVSRNAYHTYLEVLSFIGNVAKSDVDLFNFPTAQELNLPKKGRFGMSLNSSPDYLSLRVSYEHSVLESLSSSSGMTVVAVVGILAAYAIPAYKDYTVRSKVNEKMYFVGSYKVYISESYITNGVPPTAEQFVEEMGESNDYLYNEENGSFTILFSEYDDPTLSDKYINLIPKLNENSSIFWECESDINKVHLPPLCKY